MNGNNIQCYGSTTSQDQYLVLCKVKKSKIIFILPQANQKADWSMFNRLGVRAKRAFQQGIVMVRVPSEFLDGLSIEMIEEVGRMLALIGFPAQKEI